MGIATLLSMMIFLIMISFSLINLTYGVCIFLMVRILVPEDVRLPFANISLNTGIIAALFIMTILQSIVRNGRLGYNKKLLEG